MSLNEGVLVRYIALRTGDPCSAQPLFFAVRVEAVVFFIVVDRQNTGIEIEVMLLNIQAFRVS
jgi:hypothetical protein